MLKPGFSQRIGEALTCIYQNGLIVGKLQMGFMSKETAELFYAEHQGKPFYPTLMQYMTSGPVVAMELVGPNAISKWRSIIGPTNLETAKREAPNSLRALYARNTTENFAHGSDAPETAERELGIIFGQKRIQLVSEIDDTTCCVVKPHALKAGDAGPIINMIANAGFEITGAMTVSLDTQTAGEFLEIYRGVAADYVESVKELSSGTAIVLELKHQNGDSVERFRELCGPRDVAIAKAIRKQSIRAKFGKSTVQNAVHCTDLPGDASLENEYFFTLLAQEQ